MQTPTHIGIAGTFASGKDTLGHFLVEKYGFQLASTSDVVRKYSMQRHNSIERPFLYETAEFYRKHQGPDFFVKELLKEYAGTSRGLAISGLRATGEAQAIRDTGGVIVFIDAPSELRYDRMKTRARDSEVVISYEEFMKREHAEWHHGDGPGDFSFKNLKANADHQLQNGHNTEEFFAEAIKALGL